MFVWFSVKGMIEVKESGGDAVFRPALSYGGELISLSAPNF